MVERGERVEADETSHVRKMAENCRKDSFSVCVYNQNKVKQTDGMTQIHHYSVEV